MEIQNQHFPFYSLIPSNLRKFAPKFREVLYKNEASDYFLEVMDDFVVGRRVDL